MRHICPSKHTQKKKKIFYLVVNAILISENRLLQVKPLQNCKGNDALLPGRAPPNMWSIQREKHTPTRADPLYLSRPSIFLFQTFFSISGLTLKVRPDCRSWYLLRSSSTSSEGSSSRRRPWSKIHTTRRWSTPSSTTQSGRRRRSVYTFSFTCFFRPHRVFFWGSSVAVCSTYGHTKAVVIADSHQLMRVGCLLFKMRVFLLTSLFFFVVGSSSSLVPFPSTCC